ncbi:hypothetical protein BDF19DRAFT_414173 [Syncephalis fuscata]|nr:hypothetical protein BDF19DRAFT_414173 [Syncephalis fuscata]
MFVVFIAAMIMQSVTLNIIDSLPELRNNDDYMAVILSKIKPYNIVVFSIDYFARLYASAYRLRFIIQPLQIIDLISLFTYFVDQFLPPSKLATALHFIRVLRIFRLFRGFQPSQRSINTRMVFYSLRRSKVQIATFISYLIVALIISSTLMYIVEQDVLDEQTGLWTYHVNGTVIISPFQSVPHTFWWSISTLTTVGYGDNVPRTALGKMIALPSSILGASFLNEWQHYHREKYNARVRLARASHKKNQPPASEAEQIRRLRAHNELLVNAVADVQESLATVNPTMHYQLLREAEKRERAANQFVAQLYTEVQTLRSQLQQNADHNLDFVDNRPQSFLSLFRRERHQLPTALRPQTLHRASYPEATSSNGGDSTLAPPNLGTRLGDRPTRSKPTTPKSNRTNSEMATTTAKGSDRFTQPPTNEIPTLGGTHMDMRGTTHLTISLAALVASYIFDANKTTITETINSSEVFTYTKCN